MTNTSKQVKAAAKAEKRSTRNYSKLAAVVQAVVITVAIAFGAGFFFGNQHANSQHEQVNVQAAKLSASLK